MRYVATLFRDASRPACKGSQPLVDDRPGLREDSRAARLWKRGWNVCQCGEAPDHKYHSVHLDSLDVDVTDAGDPTVSAADVTVPTVWSDEDEDARGGGDGSTKEDILIDTNSCRVVDLRAERQAQANGRVYTLTLKAADASENVGSNTFQVHVPKDIEVSPLGTDDGPTFTVSAATCEPLPSSTVASNTSPAEDDSSSQDGAPRKKTPSAQIEEVELRPNSPNPFTQGTEITFALPSSQPVRLAVYDAMGRFVKELVNTSLPKGRYTVRFHGYGLSSGMYFYRLNTGSYVQTRKMSVVR